MEENAAPQAAGQAFHSRCKQMAQMNADWSM
jgi:hypothetical protein